MENITNLIERLSKEKRIIVRSPQAFSWGSREDCERIFDDIFPRVNGSIRRYHRLPEYVKAIDWMANTEGRGLFLMGDCGRGKSIICTGMIPVLLAIKGYHTFPIHADDFEKPYPFAASTAGCDLKTTNLDYLSRTRFPIIDELGVESMVNNYGEKSEGFNKVINTAERYLRPLFVSTNLTKEELLRRYGERTFDRLSHLCRIIKFKGESLR